MIRTFLVLILLFMGLQAKSLDIKNKCMSDISKFSQNQKEIIIKAYEFGNRYGLGPVLAAIAWQESCAGVYLVNFQDPSAGVFHAYIPNLLKKYKNLQDNGFTVNMVGQKLINDFDFSAKEAVNELMYWKKIHNGNMEKMIKSYNKGFSWQSQAGAAQKANHYYSSVASKLRKVKRFLQNVDVNQIYLAKNETPKLPIYTSGKKDFEQQNELAKFIMVEY